MAPARLSAGARAARSHELLDVCRASQAALDQLLERLVDIPTPAGTTPREIGAPATPTLLPIIAVNQGKE